MKYEAVIVIFTIISLIKCGFSSCSKESAVKIEEEKVYTFEELGIKKVEVTDGNDTLTLYRTQLDSVTYFFIK